MNPFSSPHPRLEAFRRRVLERDPATVNTGWQDVLIPQGLALAARAFDDTDAIEWVRRWAALQLAQPIREVDYAEIRPGMPSTGIFLTDFCGNWGFPLAACPLPEARDDGPLRNTILRVANHIHSGCCRLSDGSMAHGGWDFGRRTLWVDTLYYTSSVLAEVFRITGDETHAREALRQCLRHADHLRDPLTGLFFHDAEPGTRLRTPAFWSRGNGWVVMAFADTLRACPRNLDGWDQALSIYQDLVCGLLRFQHSSGLWRIVPEQPDAHLETSGTAMITCGIAVGVGESLLERSLAASVERSLRELLTWIHPETGAFLGSQRPAGLGGWETHKLSELGECTYATGIFLRLLSEIQTYKIL